VLLPSLRTFGLWRVETHSWYAAAELRSAIELALGLAARTGEHLAQGVLRIEQRAVKRPGQSVQRFTVPVLDVALSAQALPESAAARPTASVSARDALALVAPSDGEEAESTRARDRGAPTTPVTSLPPDEDDGAPPTLTAHEREARDTARATHPAADPERARSLRAMFATVAAILPDADKDARNSLRYALAVMVTTKTRAEQNQPPATSWNDLTGRELVKVEQLLRDVQNGGMVAEPRGDGGWHFALRSGRSCDIYQDTNGAWTYNVAI
jgi:hypothetical protein